MKAVIAVVKPFVLDAVKESLKGIGVQGLTVMEVQGYGRQGGHTETYRGNEYNVDLVPKLRLEVLCDSGQEVAVMEAIRAGANTGKIGDGKIWVLDVDQLMRIRTGEIGKDAL